ncbi:serine hydrolase domain-containing protein [Lentilactobacillus parakefiri]|uniref:Serine hydrolase n=1 Tax=Lentilactobacillus parakefiri TaxID=152332 RepID=A0A224VHZ9_9LACO|nr:serine hydrolase domain-containing protein [Lentilactobacillus parakefiri]KRL70898.1 beta-lactamase [Lentilactobacillus parakefiri DSM 10551]TDG94543.1 hypothetical protein C5L28_000800 [Lentilactobacillus parakefiri]GAW72171.1 serine hydrolase [Lentilactobacillus parakefiri]
MKWKRAYTYIIIIFLVIGGVIGGAIYWRSTNHEFQVQRAAKVDNAKKRAAAESSDQQRKHVSDERKVPPKAQGRTPKETKQITHYLKLNHFVGSALVVKNNRVVYRGSLGYADYASRRANTNQSEYQILSIQKSLTAAMVMKLIQDRKLSLNTRLATYYPTIKNAQNITIRQMLDMDSGLTMAEGGAGLPLNEKRVVNYAVHHVVTRSKNYRDWYQPVNFVLLAGIISKITHKSYVYEFKKLFIKPLHLKGTGFVQNWRTRPHRTIGYHWLKSTQLNQNYDRPYHEAQSSMRNELGTGQVFMTALDLFKAESQLLKGKIISQNNVDVLHVAGTNSGYGGGIYNEPNGIRSHGIGYGYESSLFLTRDGKSGVVLLSNDYRPDNPIQDLAIQLFSTLAT